MRKLESRTWVGSGEGRINEDYASGRPDAGYAILVDGATGLTKANLVAGETDAAWYARNLCERTLLYAGDGMGMRYALERAGKDLAQEYLAMPGGEDLQRIDYPNGSVAMFEWNDDVFTVAMLGDCTAVVGLKDGSSVLIHDHTLDKLDQQNYERMHRYCVEHGTTMQVARKELNDYFVRNRLTMNESGGYWAADITCRGFGHEMAVTFDAADVRFAFACSDGFAAAVDMGVVKDAIELAERVAKGEGEHMGTLLRQAELEDVGCMRVHRSKTSDDATYILIR